ncbi:MAG TPA: J domain-containing protein [Candidatus Micrarchaeia archaeon]|nr:J domain-containing protein [Candidatus Micrarchaeia archaeon]
MEFHDYYATLGVARAASPKEVQAAYRKLARQLHPDVNKDPKATERFKRVNEAYEVLKDPAKRRKYDQLGANWEQLERSDTFRRQAQEAAARATAAARAARQAAGGAAAGARGRARFGGFSDFFETFFSGRSGAGQDPLDGLDLDELLQQGRTGGAAAPVAPRAQDATSDITVRLAEAISGGRRTIRIGLTEPCPTCHGRGAVAAPEPGQGHGTVQVTMVPCPTCAGHGTVERARTLSVTIPPGVTEGSKIRIAGEGGAGRSGGPAGHLFLTVHLERDPRLEVRGRDLHGDLVVRDYRAVLGGSATAELPTGRIEVTVPAGCPAGKVFRLRGKGIPGLRPQDPAGDLYLTVRVTTALGAGGGAGAERRAYEQLAAADGVRVPVAEAS